MMVNTRGEPGIDSIGIPDALLNKDAPLSVLTGDTLW